jgi:hypothetical protein
MNFYGRGYLGSLGFFEIVVPLRTETVLLVFQLGFVTLLVIAQLSSGHRWSLFSWSQEYCCIARRYFSSRL